MVARLLNSPRATMHTRPGSIMVVGALAQKRKWPLG